jgi:hypothetical protein
MELNGSTPTLAPTTLTKNIRRVRKRTAPPPQDKLVLVFISASTIFACISLSPFIFGHFPNHDDVSLFRRHNGMILHQLHNTKLYEDSSRDVGNSNLPLSRGFSGLPMSSTPALIGAKHGSITCSSDSGAFNLDELAYWNVPGPYDSQFVSPFASKDTQSPRRYVTFEPDRGGWNNIRMSMEIIFVFAAATGRTLVLPPDTPFYLLGDTDGMGSKHHGFADFIDIGKIQGLDIITMTEFLQIEGQKGGLLTLPTGRMREKTIKSAEYCYYVSKSDRPCDAIYQYLKNVAYVPELQAGRECLVFDHQSQDSKFSSILDSDILDALPEEKQQRITEFCTGKRKPIFFRGELATAPHIHFHSGDKFHRLLGHYYTFLHFTDAKVGNHFKRFVRDYLHYKDDIYCAAGKIISLLEEEASHVGWQRSKGPGYSSMHIRRGDFQYKKTKISAEEWLNATMGILRPGEIVYVATDEKDLSFFNPLKQHYNVKFLDQFSKAAGLDELDPNYSGELYQCVFCTS